MRNFFSKFYILFFLVFICSTVLADEAFFELGGKAGWSAVDLKHNIEFTRGRLGRDAIKLASREAFLEQSSDLYLSFDSKVPVELCGNYDVKQYSYIFAGSNDAKFGSGAAMCSPQVKEPCVVLSSNDGAFFNGGEILSSFTVDFWIYPEVTESGSVILQWRSSLIQNNNMMYQHIIASIMQNKMDWSFTNIWQRNNKGIDVKLRSKSNIVPNRWSHHLLTYDADSGLLEYRMNGVTEAVDYLTVTGHDGGQPFFGFMGRSSDVVVGLNYSGYLDELKLTKIFKDVSNLEERMLLFDKYDKAGGRLESSIIDTGGDFSLAKYFSVDSKLPEQTGVAYFIRSSNNRYNWSKTEPAWKPICPNCKVKDVQGRYMQVAVDLYPDGSGTRSPVVHSIKLSYEQDSLPIPPASIWADSLDSSVKLSWTPSSDFDVDGYLVYFGERSGEYYYPGSPVDVGNVLSYNIDGLRNGRIYFFVVAAYDKGGPSNMGNFSKEVWARPKACKKCEVE